MHAETKAGSPYANRVLHSVGPGVQSGACRQFGGIVSRGMGREVFYEQQ